MVVRFSIGSFLSVILFLSVIPSSHAVGIIPDDSIYSVGISNQVFVDFLVKGGPESQKVVFFVESSSPSLTVEGKVRYETNITLSPAELRDISVRLQGVSGNPSVNVVWGLKVPSVPGSFLSFDQVISDNITVRVLGSGTVNIEVNNSNNSSSSGVVNTAPVRTRSSSSNSSINFENDIDSGDDYSNEDYSNENDEGVRIQDISPEGSAFSEVIIPSDAPKVAQSFSVIDNSSGNYLMSKRSVGLMLTILLLMTGFLMILVSNNLRRKVY